MELHSFEMKNSCVFDMKQIANILPHKYPFLLVDRIIHLDLAKPKPLIVGKKNLTINEQFFQGHFPIVPIMPGVLMIEALAQTGGILIHQMGYHDKIALLLSVNRAKFRRPATPGDTLILHVEGLQIGARGGKVQGTALIEDQIVTEAEITFALRNTNQL